MKTILALALLLASPALAWEAGEPQLVRVLDGKNVPCKERHEVGRVTWNAGASNLTLDENFLAGEIGIDVVSCVMRGESEFALEPRLPLAPKEYLGDDKQPVRIEYRDADLFVGNADYRGLQVLPLEDKTEQRIAFRVELAKALTPAQRRDLADGKPVRARLALLARRIATLVRDGQNTPLGQEFLGSFTFFVTLRR